MRLCCSRACCGRAVQFERILKQNSRTVMGDAFVKIYIDDLLKNIRTQAQT